MSTYGATDLSQLDQGKDCHEGQEQGKPLHCGCGGGGSSGGSGGGGGRLRKRKELGFSSVMMVVFVELMPVLVL